MSLHPVGVSLTDGNEIEWMADHTHTQTDTHTHKTHRYK